MFFIFIAQTTCDICNEWSPVNSLFRKENAQTIPFHFEQYSFLIML